MPLPSPFPVSRRRMLSSSSSPPPPSEAPLPLLLLPADIQVEILSLVGDAVSVVRCAATCKAWRRLIKDPGFFSHLRRRCRAEGFDPSFTLLGFFFRDTSQSLPRRRLYRRRPTRFLLLSNSRPESSAPLVLPLSRFLTTADDFKGYAPVASGGGGLVALCRFQLPSPVRSPGICVCNPLAGTSTLLPPLPSTFVPEKIIFLEADSTSFRLLAVMDDRHGMLIMLVFSSLDNNWDEEHIVQLPDNMVVDFTFPSVVHRSAVYWICGTRALPHAVHVVAVYLSEAGSSVSRFNLPPGSGVHHLTSASEAMRLVSSAQGTLSFILLDELVLSIWNLDEDSSTGRKQWLYCEAVDLMPMLPPSISSAGKVDLSIQGLCEKSGSLFLNVGGEGLFMLNLKTKKLVNVCKGDFTKYLCPYVTDLASCVEAMKSY